MFILLTIILFEFIIVLHEIGHLVSAKLLKVPVKEFYIGFGPLIATFEKNETKYGLRAFPLGGYVSFEEDYKFFNVPVFKRMLIVISGPFINLLAGFIAISIAVLVQGKYNTTIVDSVKYYNNIEVGDIIEAVNGNKIFGANDFLYNISKIPLNEDINLTIYRNKKKLKLFNVARLTYSDYGIKREIGISLKVDSVNFFSFFSQTVNNFIYEVKLIVSSIVNLFFGKTTIKEFSGPVGLAKTVNETKTKGIAALIFLFAFLSINIAIFNIIPFPVLDGGQMVFLVYEFILNKRVKKDVQDIFNFSGIFILFFIFVLVTCKDLINLFNS